jgi:hypothetical protein
MSSKAEEESHRDLWPTTTTPEIAARSRYAGLFQHALAGMSVDEIQGGGGKP